MNRFFIAAYILFSAFSLPLFAADKIVAVVNGDIITEQELQEFENVLMYKIASEYSNPEEGHARFLEAKKDALNNLIEDRLILNFAKEQEYEIEDSSIEKRLDQFRSQYPSEDQFEADLVKRGISVDVLRKKILDQILMKQVVAHKVNSQIAVKPYEITEFYKANKDKFVIDEKIKYQALVFQDLEAAQDASEVFKKAKRNHDLGMVLDRYKDALRKGELEKSSVMDELAVLFENAEQIVYDPIAVGDDYYTFIITERVPESVVPLADAHGGISSMIYQQKYQKKFDDWVASIKEGAVVEIKDAQ